MDDGGETDEDRGTSEMAEDKGVGACGSSIMSWPIDSSKGDCGR